MICDYNLEKTLKYNFPSLHDRKYKDQIDVIYGEYDVVFKCKLHNYKANYLSFGPAEICFSKLNGEGWYLETKFDFSEYVYLSENDMTKIHGVSLYDLYRKRNSKLILKNDYRNDRYVIKKSLSFLDATRSVNFCEFISSTKNYLLTKHQISDKLDKPNRTVQIVNKVEPITVEQAFEKLRSEYKTKPKDTTMVGNMTIVEYVKQQLKGI